MSNLDRILSKWVRLGAMFNIAPARKTPDIEQLLLDTVSVVPEFARVHSMMISWLARYEKLVCRHRLAAMANRIEIPKQSAALGFTLSLARKQSGSDHFNYAIKRCRPLAEPQALFEIDRQNEKLIELAKRYSCELGKQWGVWAQEERLYDDAIRPTDWIMQKNPSLKTRAVFGGKLQASILATLEVSPQAGRSESALARACLATRKAIRDALDHLELCQLVARKYDKGFVSIH